jgi:glycosyltransferase involved in cell wall biosynthesis
MTRVAVLLPTLGRAGWDEHLPALLGQTRAPDRIIVVIDREISAAERLDFQRRWPQVSFIFNDARLGITKSLNIGLAAAADADVIVRADDDDESFPRRIELQLDLMERDGADLVAGWAEGRGESGGTYLIRCPTTHDAILDGLKKRNCLIHPALTFRRAPIMALGGYDETFVNAQDYGLYLASIRAGLRFSAVGEPVVKRFYHGNNISVERRMHQLMYSCAARAAHHAATGDRAAFIRSMLHYLQLAATPMWLRRARRRVFSIIGRGA